MADNIFKDLLTRLESGKEITLSFPNSKEREAFRVALYKEKRLIDEQFLMTDPEFECEQLSFKKTEGLLNKTEANFPSNISYLAILKIQPKAAAQRRDYQFTVIDERDIDIHPDDPDGELNLPSRESQGAAQSG